MSLTLFHDPGFAAPIGKHIMPIRKFGLVADELRSIAGIELRSPEPVSNEDLLRVHTPEYLGAIESGEPKALAESQKFPWSPALFPSVRLTSGGVLATSRQALKDGVSGALASGFHHSCADHGEGFCTFNGLVVALEKLRAEGVIKTAAVLDLDLHYGNGTASLAVTRPWLRALSIYGNDYANNVAYRDVTQRHHEDGPNHFSVPIVPGANDGENLLALLDQHLPWLIEAGKPDLLLFQAGADPFREDPYSPLNLSHEDLYKRDHRVFTFAREHGLPVAWVLAGGYTEDVRQVVKVHVNTALACLDVYNFS
jgi:acetoin utilization deacetylase AcuC-like enzyme